jgi:hypothetical protein
VQLTLAVNLFILINICHGHNQNNRKKKEIFVISVIRCPLVQIIVIRGLYFTYDFFKCQELFFLWRNHQVGRP